MFHEEKLGGRALGSCHNICQICAQLKQVSGDLSKDHNFVLSYYCDSSHSKQVSSQQLFWTVLPAGRQASTQCTLQSRRQQAGHPAPVTGNTWVVSRVSVTTVSLVKVRPHLAQPPLAD